MEQQRSLRVLDTNKTFFSKLTSTITKMLIPTRVGINTMMISMKRNNLIKSYTNYIIATEEDDVDKKESLFKKYEESYSLYLEAIDKYIMDSLYKKVKNGTATEFEKNSLSKYYMVVSLKQDEYIEYKYRKQEYLIRIDYESVVNSSKGSIKEKYDKFYVSKMDSIYKGILKNYSVQLADRVKATNADIIYQKIFKALEEYISEILPIKMEVNNSVEYKAIMKDYEQYETMQVGKLDERDLIRKKIILLGLSRELFTHSLPLIVAEKCYINLLKETRSLLLKDENKIKREKTFNLLVELIQDYNVRLLSTKVYWEKPAEREQYKKFWAEYSKIEKIKNKEEQNKQKVILFLKSDVKKLCTSKKYNEIINILKEKLVELGAMKQLKNKCKTATKYIKVCKEN